MPFIWLDFVIPSNPTCKKESRAVLHPPSAPKLFQARLSQFGHDLVLELPRCRPSLACIDLLVSLCLLEFAHPFHRLVLSRSVGIRFFQCLCSFFRSFFCCLCAVPSYPLERSVVGKPMADTGEVLRRQTVKRYKQARMYTKCAS